MLNGGGLVDVDGIFVGMRLAALSLRYHSNPWQSSQSTKKHNIHHIVELCACVSPPLHTDHILSTPGSGVCLGILSSHLKQSSKVGQTLISYQDALLALSIKQVIASACWHFDFVTRKISGHFPYPSHSAILYRTVRNSFLLSSFCFPLEATPSVNLADFTFCENGGYIGLQCVHISTAVMNSQVI